MLISWQQLEAEQQKVRDLNQEIARLQAEERDMKEEIVRLEAEEGKAAAIY